MCIEDYRLGKKSRSYLRTATLGAADKIILAPNSDRVSVIFLSNNTFNYIVCPAGDSTVAGHGVGSGNNPVRFNVQLDGQTPELDWHASAPAGAPVIAFIETILTVELKR